MTRCCVLLLAICIAAPRALGDDLPADRERATDDFVGQFAELAMFDGTIVVDQGGAEIYRQSFGFANVEHGVRHDENTRFHLASVSKALTDAAVARMIERGLFALDTPLARFLPGFPSASDITIAHLVNHASGIPHTNRQPWGDGSQSLMIDEIVDRLARLPLDFEPGTDTAYSNGGYAVLARVLEIAGNGSFSEVMRATVFDPLDMRDSGHVTDVRTPLARTATGYQPGLRPGERRRAQYYAIESRPGGGSFYSTASDMLKFMRAVFRGDFVSEALRRAVMGEDEDGYLSQGRSPGFVAKALYRPQDDVIVVSLSNNYAVPSDWALALADLSTGKASGNPWSDLRPVSGPVPADDPRPGRYMPSYSETPILVSRSASGDLLISDDEHAKNALIPLLGGDFLQPLYFQRCVQDATTRVFVCTMLSGETAYTSTFTPIDEAM